MTSFGSLYLHDIEEAIVSLKQEIGYVLRIYLSFIQYSHKITSQNPTVFLKPFLPRVFF